MPYIHTWFDYFQAVQSIVQEIGPLIYHTFCIIILSVTYLLPDMGNVAVAELYICCNRVIHRSMVLIMGYESHNISYSPQYFVLILWSYFRIIVQFIIVLINTTALKRKCHNFDEIFIIGCTGSCHFDNFQCSQWWKFHQNYDISVSVSDIQISWSPLCHCCHSVGEFVSTYSHSCLHRNFKFNRHFRFFSSKFWFNCCYKVLHTIEHVLACAKIIVIQPRIELLENKISVKFELLVECNFLQ